MFAVPSLKPNRLRGVACDVEVDEVRPKPSCDQRMRGATERDAAQVADRVDGDLRVVGAGLDAEVAAGLLGYQGVAREAGERLQLRPGAVGERRTGSVEQARARSRR